MAPTVSHASAIDGVSALRMTRVVSIAGNRSANRLLFARIAACR
jgi:hypothetical protein